MSTWPEQANAVKDHREDDVTGDQILLQKIFCVTRGDLETTVFPFSSAADVIRDMALARVDSIARFWVRNGEEASSSLGPATEDFVSGLYGEESPLLFLICGNASEISVCYGVRASYLPDNSLQAMLRGVFPDIRVSDATDVDMRRFTRLKRAVIVSGVPTKKTIGQDATLANQIETVCRGLFGSVWLFGVYAEPVPSANVVRLQNEVAVEIRNIYATHLLKASAADQENQLAKHYVNLLEAQQRRLEEGRISGMWAVHGMLFTEDPIALGRGKALLRSAFAGVNSTPEPFRVVACGETSGPLPVLEPLTTVELATLIRPPKEEFPGYRLFDYTRFGVNPGTDVKKGRNSIQLGTLVDQGMNIGNPVQVSRDDFAKHAFVGGVTGSGKTNTCFGLLDQLWDQQRGVPFLIIEPAKSEYRQLLTSERFKDLKVFTVGDERVSPLRLNPLAVPSGILIESHIDYVKSLFGAAFVLYPPMPYVLERSLQEIYVDRGWDLAANVNRRGEGSERQFPCLSDLATKIAHVVDRMGYDERLTMDIKAGLLARVTQLTRGGGKGLMLDTRNSMDALVLFESPCLLELKQLVSDEEKAFVMGLILILLYEYHITKGPAQNQRLRHITLIEEAHRLLKNVSTEQGSEVHANPKGHAIEVFANVLAEIRSFGEGIIISEQIPTKLAPEVLKNTNLKLIHRLVAEDDRNLVGASMNLTSPQRKHLAMLQPGDAVIFAENLLEAVLIRVPLSDEKTSNQHIDEADIRKCMSSFWASHQNLRLTYTACQRCSSESRARYACRRSRAGDSDLAVLEGFKRLFNSMRLSKAMVWEAFGEFSAALCRKPSRVKDSSYCTFVGLVNEEIERRGEAAHWDYADIDRAIQLACECIHHVVAGFGRDDRKTAEKAATRSLTMFANLLERLHKRDPLPYPGCQLCASPCSYEFDMAAESLGEGASYFGQVWSKSSDPWPELASLCWAATSSTTLASDVRTRRGAAFCVGVQQLHFLRLPMVRQKEFAGELAAALESENWVE